MRRRLLFTGLLSLVAPLGLPQSAAFAQAVPPADAGQEPPAQEPAPAGAPAAAPAPASTPAAPAEPAAPGAEPAPAPSSEPTLPPPALAPIELTPPPATLPDPNDAAKTLQQAAPPPPAEKRGWTAPETIFHLHGYFRLRGNLLKDGDLGHSAEYDRYPYQLSGDDERVARRNYDPFPFFSPADSNTAYPNGNAEGEPRQNPIAGGCSDNPNNSDGRCDKKTQVSADMRLRLKPEIHLSDDVRVKAWVDVLDNVGLGTLGYGPSTDYRDLEGEDTIRVRRVWGEARNRDIGELRFGRMGADWGLGILDNGGDRYGIDSDFSSDVDRIMGITNLAGFYLMAAYDWASEGVVQPGTATPSGVPIDSAQKDDLDVITLAVARRMEPELQQSALLRGEAVFNYGAYFVYRDQFLQWDERYQGDEGFGARQFARLNQTQYIPDLWLQVLWEGLRVELEAAYVAGSLEGQCPKLVVENNNPRDATEIIATSSSEDVPPEQLRGTSGSCKLRQLGIALEAEYRLFDDRLGIYFMSGLATGDNNGYGLAVTNDPSFQRVGNETNEGDREISTYQFHPDYRVDLILWRTLMRRVAGGYYFKPGVSYDFIRDAYGQQAGGRFDVIYSRASSPKQTWGRSGNLGLELDLSLYYRSEDGPDPLDGFYGLVQWGVLFPFDGLDYRDAITGAPDTKNAMIFRGVAGIAF